MSSEDPKVKEQMAWIKQLSPYLQGDQWALQFCVDIMYVAHVWDDLIDQDGRTRQEISEAFRIALIDIPQNPFYLAHMQDLRPLMMNAILQWQDANTLELEGRNERAMAFMLKASVLQLFNYCAYLVGGPQWAAEKGPEMRLLYHESIDDYLREKDNA